MKRGKRNVEMRNFRNSSRAPQSPQGPGYCPSFSSVSSGQPHTSPQGDRAAAVPPSIMSPSNIQRRKKEVSPAMVPFRTVNKTFVTSPPADSPLQLISQNR